MRILVIQDVYQWTGEIEEQEYLEVPDQMNVGVEEKNWFAQGGGTLEDFIAYLVTKGAKKLTSVETWVINYP